MRDTKPLAVTHGDRAMVKEYFSHDQIQERPNSRFAAKDPFQIHYHFRPARPADLCVTRDVQTGEINVSAGTLGPLTWNPYTMCLHISRQGSPHTYQNLNVGGHCVVALPGRELAEQTWFTALPLPRGISEAEVAGLHTCPSKFINVPGIEECPVNFECLVEFKHDYHTHGIVFVRVLGASIDKEVLAMDREQVLHWYPTYEVDDVVNRFGGSIERLGLMGEIVACPTFPRAPKKGWYQTFALWMRDLHDEGYLGRQELDRICGAVAEYERIATQPDDPRRKRLHEWITKLSQRIVRLDWDAVHAMLKES